MRRSALCLLVLTLTACTRFAPTAPLILQGNEFALPYRMRSDPMPWSLYPGIPKTDLVFYYDVIEGPNDQNEVGHVIAVQYPDTATADRGYVAIFAEAANGDQARPLDIGETGFQSLPSAYWRGSDVMFRRCNTIVHLTLQGNTLDQLVRIAQRVDTRIQALTCPK